MSWDCLEWIVRLWVQLRKDQMHNIIKHEWRQGITVPLPDLSLNMCYFILSVWRRVTFASYSCLMWANSLLEQSLTDEILNRMPSQCQWKLHWPFCMPILVWSQIRDLCVRDHYSIVTTALLSHDYVAQSSWQLDKTIWRTFMGARTDHCKCQGQFCHDIYWKLIAIAGNSIPKTNPADKVSSADQLAAVLSPSDDVSNDLWCTAHWWSLTTWYVVHRSTIISAQSLHYQVVVFWQWSRRCIERHGDGDCYHSVVLQTSAALCVQAVLCTGVLSTRLLWWSLVYWHSHIPAESTKIVKKVKVSLYRRYFHELQNKKAQLTLSNPRDVKACKNCSNSTCFVSFHRIPFPEIANA